MLRLVRLFFKGVLAVAALGAVMAALGLSVARASLPASDCAVSEAAIAALELEKMSDRDVIQRLGCDGVHAIEMDAAGLRIENVAWQGDVWPYGLFEAHFINGVLHGTKKTWLNLEISANKS